MTRLGPHIAPTEATQAVAHRAVSPPPSSLPSERSAESPCRCKDSGGGAALIFSSTRPFLLASLLDSSPVPASVGASRLGGCRSGSHGLRGLLVRICSHRRWYGGAGWRMLLGRRRRSCSSVAVVRWCTRALRDLAGAQRRLRFVSAYLPCRVPPSSRRAS